MSSIPMRGQDINLNFVLSSLDSEEFTTQILGFSAEVNGQRPFAKQKSTRDASKVPEGEGVKPEVQVIRPSFNQLPHGERILLENLFSFFIKWEQLSHVLFFETKPVCFTGIPVDYNHSVTPPCISKNPLKFQEELYEGWKVWKKYEHLFDHPHFLICEETRQLEEGEKHGKMIDVFFINKTSLLSFLNKHQHIFKKELGENFSPASFLSEIEEKKTLRPFIKHDEMLLGLLLGYGHKASSAFREKELGYELDTPMKSVGKTLKGCKFSPVCFRGDPLSEESKNLINKYSEELSSIWNIYQEKNLLEITLDKLCQSSP